MTSFFGDGRPPVFDKLDAIYARVAKHRVWSWFTDYGREGSAEHLTDAVDKADVISSTLRGPDGEPIERHVVMLDVDHPVIAVESSTRGHHHLIIDVPGGVEHEAYMNLLDALAAAGVIEEGYAGAARRRGYTSLRPYWKPKGRAVLRCANCKQRPEDLDEYRQSAWAEIYGGSSDDPETPTLEDMHAQEIIDWTYNNEGTLNKLNGAFWCTKCYIELGMPLGVPMDDVTPSSPLAWPPPALGPSRGKP